MNHKSHLYRWLVIALLINIAIQLGISWALAKPVPTTSCPELLAKHPKTHMHIHMKCRSSKENN